MIMSIHRGDTFRPEFSRLGEVRSVIPESVHVIALTATATNTTRAAIIKTLDMQRPAVVSIYPGKDNIVYYVAEMCSISVSLAPNCDKLAIQRTKMGRVIVFCRTYDEVTAIYYYFKRRLGIGFTEPPGAPDIMQFRLVDMYTHCTHQSVKDSILHNFKIDSPLRIVVATVAFGLGVDCPDVRHIIHWGVPDDMETFIQETGRAGRDGKVSCSLLFYSKGDLNKKRTSEQLINYCKNEGKVCCRQLVFTDFDKSEESSRIDGCMCCCICKQSCQCRQCELKLKDVFILASNKMVSMHTKIMKV